MAGTTAPAARSCPARFITNVEMSSGLIRLDCELDAPLPFRPGQFAMLNLADGLPLVFDAEVDVPTLGTAGLAALREAATSDAFIDVRTTATRALGLAGVPAKDVLMTLAHDADARVREEAVTALAPLAGDDVLALLDAAVDDANDGVSGAALAALVERSLPGVFTRIVARFDATSQVRLQRDLVELAGLVDDPRVLPFLIGVARNNPERWVRAAALGQLGQPGWRFPDQVFRQLCASLNDESYEVRAAAADALAELGDPRAAVHLRARLDLEDDVTTWQALADALDAVD